MKFKTNKTTLGIFFYLIGMFLCVMLNTTMKKTINEFHLPTYEILFIRQLCIVLFLTPLMIKNKFNFFDKKSLKPNLYRNILFSASLGLLYFGITRVPLNDSTAISFLTPIIGCLLAVKLLGEKSSKAIWVALCLSVVGMLIIKTPQFGDDIEVLIGYGVLLVAVCIRGYIVVLNKKLAQKFDTMTILFYNHIVLMLFSGCFFFQFKAISFVELCWIILIGLMFFAEYWFIFKAYKYTTAVVLQPLDFSRLIFMMFVSSLLMNEKTTINQVIGGIVIFSGYVFMLIFNNGKTKQLKK